MHSFVRTARMCPVASSGMSIRTITSRAIVFPSTGNPHDVLSLHSYSLPDTPKPDSVLVKFLAAPINPADLNQIEGVYPSKARFQSIQGKQGDWAVGGNEGVVKILDVGDQVTAEGIEKGRWAIMKSTAFGTHTLGSVLMDRDMENTCRDYSRRITAVTKRSKDPSSQCSDDFRKPLHGRSDDA